jgi:hypothetical protein
MTIRLSALGITHMQFDDLQKDFTFHVDRNEYKCSSFIAFFFSPKLSRSHRGDPTLDEAGLRQKIAKNFSKKNSFGLSGL